MHHASETRISRGTTLIVVIRPTQAITVAAGSSQKRALYFCLFGSHLPEFALKQTIDFSFSSMNDLSGIHTNRKNDVWLVTYQNFILLE